LPETANKPARRWTVIASALLIAPLGLVVFYTSRSAFFSPLAVMVVAAIGLAALLLQIHCRHDLNTVRTPIWLNALGILCAFVAVFGDKLKLDSQLTELMALAAVGCFAISGVIVLDAIRRRRAVTK
jgi:Na+/H+-translocating membrane pyrophosphatase